MKKMLRLLLVMLVLMFAYLSPLQHLTQASSDGASQYLATNSEVVLTSNVLISEKNNHTDFPQLPSFIFILLLILLVQSKFESYASSFIPLMKHLYLLYPIKYQSRFLVQDPTHV
jgi:hypothetical protein